MLTLYIDVDSLRPDHVGAYGYEKPTTPNIDELAADAVRFTRSYTANSPCMPARAAWITGRYGINNGVETHGPTATSLNWPPNWDGRGGRYDYRSLPTALFHDRVTTGAVSSFPRHPAPWFFLTWHEFHQPQEPAADGEYFQTPRAETVADHAIDFLGRHDEDCFLYTQYWDPHAPYNRNESDVDRFDDSGLPEHPTASQIEEHQEWDTWRSATELEVESRSDLGRLLAGYDAEIRYADRHVGRVLDHLREQGRYDESLIVLTADHGEEFGEHGLYREHWSTHDGTQRVPLIVKPPASAGISPGTRDALVTNVDMTATVADFHDLEAPTSWQGTSLRGVLEDSAEAPYERIVFDHGLYTAQRAVRTDRWKFVRTYDPGMWGGAVPDRQLFDMHADPWEQDDVSAANPEVVEELEREMAVWAEEHVGRDEDTLKRVARVGPEGTESKEGYDGI
jgi:arylsulfatase A-like enzyme